MFIFKSRKIKGIMLKIEALKGTLSLAMQILTIACSQKKPDKYVIHKFADWCPNG